MNNQKEEKFGRTGLCGMSITRLLNWLQLYCDLVELGSRAKVRERRGVCDQTIKFTVSNLEEELGVKLINCSGCWGRFRFYPTPAGQILYDKLQGIKKELKETKRLVQRVNEFSQE